MNLWYAQFWISKIVTILFEARLPTNGGPEMRSVKPEERTGAPYRVVVASMHVILVN